MSLSKTSDNNYTINFDYDDLSLCCTYMDFIATDTTKIRDAISDDELSWYNVLVDYDSSENLIKSNINNSSGIDNTFTQISDSNISFGRSFICACPSMN